MRWNLPHKLFIITLFAGNNLLAQNIAINTAGVAAAPANMLEVTQENAAANMVAIYAINNAATTGTGYGFRAYKTGAGTTNVAGYFSASGGGANYAGIFEQGNVGIGTTTPTALLHLHAMTNPLIQINTATSDVDGALIRFTESGNFLGGFMRYESSANRLDIGIHNVNDVLIANDTKVMSILRSNGFLGIGTVSPASFVEISKTGADFLLLRQSVFGAGNDPDIRLANFANTYDFRLRFDNGSGDFHIDRQTGGVRTNDILVIKNVSGAIGVGGSTWPVTNFTNAGNSTIGNDYYRTTSPGLAIGSAANYPGNAGWPGSWNSNLLLVGQPNATLTFAHEGCCLANIRYNTGVLYLGDNAGWGSATVYTPTTTYLAATAGTVGIGMTTTPWSALSIVGTATSTTLHTSFGSTQWRMKLNVGDEGNSGTLDYRGFDANALSIVGAGTSNTNRLIRLHDYVGINNAPSTGQALYVNGTSATYNSIFLVGNVGIGTATPSTQLEVESASYPPARFTRAEPSVTLTANSAEFLHKTSGDMINDFGAGFRFAIQDNAGVNNQIGWINTSRANNQDNSGRMRFETTNAGVVNTDALVLDYTGFVGVGTPTPGYRLSVNGDLSVCGTIRYTGAVAVCSDIRYKTNIAAIPNALSDVLKIQGVNYFWKLKEFPEKQFSNEKQIGFIAQDLEKIYPELVLTDKEGYKSVDYPKLTPILVEAIKEQQRIINSQKAEIQNLNNKFEGLESIVKTLQLQISSEVKK